MPNFVKAAAMYSVLALAITSSAAFAQAGQSAQPSQTQTAPDTSMGAQTPSSQAAPSQPDTQGMAAPNSNAVEVPASGNIADQLHFTPEQRQKLSAIQADENRQISAVEADQSLSGTDKVKKIHDIRRADADKIKAMLTPQQERQLLAIQQQAGPPAQSGRTEIKPEKK